MKTKTKTKELMENSRQMVWRGLELREALYAARSSLCSARNAEGTATMLSPLFCEGVFNTNQRWRLSDDDGFGT